MRVLIVAEQCHPFNPSLPLVAYHTVKALTKKCDITLATQIRNQEPFRNCDPLNATVDFFDSEYIAAPLYKLGSWIRGGDAIGQTISTAMAYPSIIAFERQVLKFYSKRLENGEFDVIHRLTPMSPTLPSYICSKSPIPTVLGPLNGGLKWPQAFINEQKKEKETLSKFRKLHQFLPYYKSSYRNASVILAAFNHTIEDLPCDVSEKIISFPEIGICPDIFLNKNKQSKKNTVLFVGRLVPYKCPDIAVESFCRSKINQSAKLKVIGIGPMLPELKAIVKKYKMEKNVSFIGQISQEEVGQQMQEASIFTFPSIRELGAGVIAEAMASGLASVVVDYGAPGNLIEHNSTGLKVSLGEKSSITQGFIKSLNKLADHPKCALEMGRKAHIKALSTLAWDEKALRFVEVYQWAQKSFLPKPSPYPN